MKKDTNRLYCRVATLMVILAIPLWLQAASTIQFTANTYKVGESAGAASITIQRTSDTNTEVAVDYATIDGTATNGLKYTAVSGTLAFGSGQTNKTITVT